jgi:hypothetical protein
MFSEDIAWFIGVPKRADFTQPPFHFGERVKWWLDVEGVRHYLTGRIKGMLFTANQDWECWIELDRNRTITKYGLEDDVLGASRLTLVKDSSSIRNQLKPPSEWALTNEAATRLGISSDQLRNLRLKGLFKSGYHYRDSSVPGSARPRWQWHIERCGKALEVSPSKRLPQKLHP